MSKISKSPERHRLQKQSYIVRKIQEGEDPDENYLELFDSIINEHESRFSDPEKCVNNMEYDLRTTDWILEKVRGSDSYAQNLYAAICNNRFQKIDVLPILREDIWHCSWRYAGGIVADMQQRGDYLNWYCSGIMSEPESGYMPEGVVTEEIRQDLLKLKWRVVEDNNDNI